VVNFFGIDLSVGLRCPNLKGQDEDLSPRDPAWTGRAGSAIFSIAMGKLS